MKQKRKVKSLITKIQNRKKIMLMTSLLVLSLILCIWTASILMSTVWAEDSGDPAVHTRSFHYSWLDNNKEILYWMKFVDPSDFAVTVNEMSIQESGLYIWPNSIVVNPATGDNIDRSVNKVKTWVYSHILWWRNNKIYSENITLIAGSGNVANALVNNASILWWEGNELTPWYEATPEPYSIVSIWWQNNKLNTNAENIWAVFLWWSGNSVNRKARAFIVWWENNKVIGFSFGSTTNTEWWIVWGKNVTLSGINHVFVYSNSDETFEPQTSNAFYLNMEKWVWINTTWESKALFVEGAVNLSDFQLWTESCTGANLWVVASYRWCMIWCTEAWIDGGWQWELLDEWPYCKEILKNDSYILHDASDGDEEIVHDEYLAQCAGDVNTWHATLCSMRDTNVRYYNVIFETTLIDSDDPCPTSRENQCVYKCDIDFHLTWSIESGNLQCYRDCPLPWDPTRKIKHNETVVRYNYSTVECSNDTYVFPRWTEIINKPDRGYLIDTSNTLYPNRVRNGKSPETCTSHDHQKTLICNDWTLYLMKSDWQPDFTSSGDAQNYRHASCTLSDYRCPWDYDLTQQKITNEKYDEPKNGGSWTGEDRWILLWTRWVYEICIDYNADSPVQNWSSCSVAEYRYKFKECQEGYSLRSDGVCRKECELSEVDWGFSWYAHGAVVTGYQAKSATCTWTCQSASITCNDGARRLWNMDGQITTGYSYNDCRLKDKTCDSNIYNVTGATYNLWRGVSYYEPCESYNADGKFACILEDVRYHLTWCHEWYHAVGGKYCIPNREKTDCPSKPNHSHWTWLWGIVSEYPWFGIFRGIDVEQWKYIRWWNGAWDDTDWWDSIKYPENLACKWECNDKYHEDLSIRDSCVKNQCTPIRSTPNWIAVNTWSDRPWGGSNKEWTYKTWTQQSELLDCEWSCRNGYHQKEWNKCEINGCSWVKPTWAWVISWGLHPSGYEDKPWVYNTGGYIAGTLWICEWSCKDGYHRNSAWTGCEINECRYCANSNATNIWFPYCFPIDFSDTCRENDYYYSNNI